MGIDHETIENLHIDCFRILRWDKDVNSVELYHSQFQRFVPFEGIGSQWHRHPEIEITLVKSGRGLRVIGDKTDAISPSENLILLGRGLPHYWKFSDVSAGLCVQFSDIKLLTLLTELSRVEMIDLVERAAYGLEFGNKIRDDAADLMEKMTSDEHPSHMTKFGLLLQLLGVLASAGSESGRQVSSIRFDGAYNEDNYEEMQKAVAWIMENFRAEIRLQDVLDLVHMSKASFSRHFQKCTGLSFSQFVNDIRISNACILLHSTQRAISAIALESGFANLSNFNRIFLQCKGIPPSQYRKSI